MRRRLFAFSAVSLVLGLAGCGGGETVSPLPETVEGTVATEAKGNPSAGKALFEKNACGGCHTFKPAGAKGNQGPDLDELPELAKRADQGSLEEFTRTSIVNPNQYVEKGYPPIMPSFADQLSSQQVSDLVAFLTQGTS